MKPKKNFLLLLTFVSFLGPTMAQFPEGPDGWSNLGVLNGKPAKQIKKSSWSIGGETLDRDYGDYQSYKKYLGPLGAKRIRFQAGWAKCEQTKGQYDFHWLDEIIDDALAQGVQPWLCLSYGNPIYEGGGNAKLGGGMPKSDEALIAWDNWVRALARRYDNKVIEWEVWNEPDLTRKESGSAYADFFIRTAMVIREEQPESRLFALSVARVGKTEFIQEFFELVKQKRKLDLIDAVLFHGYTHNPIVVYQKVDELRAFVNSYDSTIELMQGENGCPSTPASVNRGALRNHDWTELTQAKWVLRRMLGDYGRSIATNVFTLSDLHYGDQDHFSGVNTKGLLKTFSDKTIDRPKMAYFSTQRVMGFFNDDNVALLPTDSIVNIDTTSDVSSFAYQHHGTSSVVLALWSHKDLPKESFKPTLVDLTISHLIRNPVYVDMISGFIYEVPKSQIEYGELQMSLKEIPVPDYPVLIADRSAISFTSRQ